MRFIRKSALVSAVALTALLGMGVGSANAADGTVTDSGSTVYVGERVGGEKIDAGEAITPENSRKLSYDEVRSLYSVKDMVMQDVSLGDIKKYYPTATAAEVKEIKRVEAAKPQLRITNPPCNSVDFYSIYRGADGKEFCFANAGSMAFYMPGITKVCPGNNAGNVTYRTAWNEYFTSPTRGPVLPRDYCYPFTGAVTVTGVTIF